MDISSSVIKTVLALPKELLVELKLEKNDFTCETELCQIESKYTFHISMIQLNLTLTRFIEIKEMNRGTIKE